MGKFIHLIIAKATNYKETMTKHTKTLCLIYSVLINVISAAAPNSILLHTNKH